MTDRRVCWLLSLNSTGWTRTSSPTSARVFARQSACRDARGPLSSLPAGHARRFSPTCPRTFVRYARFSSRGCPLGMRACTRVRVLYMIKQSCTRLQNYTIDAFLMSVPWGSSFSETRTIISASYRTYDRQTDRQTPLSSCYGCGSQHVA